MSGVFCPRCVELLTTHLLTHFLSLVGTSTDITSKHFQLVTQAVVIGRNTFSRSNGTIQILLQGTPVAYLGIPDFSRLRTDDALHQALFSLFFDFAREGREFGRVFAFQGCSFAEKGGNIVGQM